MGRCCDAGKQALGDVGRNTVDNHLGDGTGCRVQAFGSLPDRARVELYSDSEYLIYGMRVFVYPLAAPRLAEPARERNCSTANCGRS